MSAHQRITLNTTLIVMIAYIYWFGQLTIYQQKIIILTPCMLNKFLPPPPLLPNKYRYDRIYRKKG